MAGYSRSPAGAMSTPSALAASKYFFISAGSPSGFCMKSMSLKPASPPDSSWPGMPGGMKWLAIGADLLAAARQAQRVAVDAGDDAPCGR